MQTTNNKVKNAKVCTYQGIIFKSKLELTCYKKLLEAGLEAHYEPRKILLLKGFRMKHTRLYAPITIRGVGKSFGLNKRPIMDMTYTPDFFIENYKGYDIYFDTKGMPNETYPLKKKLFLAWAENQSRDILFFEPHTLTQIMKSIQIIKEL
jgi:hypothetical protein